MQGLEVLHFMGTHLSRRHGITVSFTASTFTFLGDRKALRIMYSGSRNLDANDEAVKGVGGSQLGAIRGESSYYQRSYQRLIN